MTTTETTFSNDLLKEELQKIQDEALKPMSIAEIQDKFKCSYPFQVKRVRNSSEIGVSNAFPVGQTFIVNKIWPKPSKKGIELVTDNKGKVDHQSAELKDYQLVE